MITLRVLTTAALAILLSPLAFAAKEDPAGRPLGAQIRGLVATPPKVAPGGASMITWRAVGASSCWVLDRGRTTPPVYPQSNGRIDGRVAVTPIADTANVTTYAVFCRDEETDFIVAKTVTVSTVVP